MNQPNNQTEKIQTILGHPGKIIGLSKSGYGIAYPTHHVVFNSNVATIDDGKIWHGDIDITKSHNDLVKLSETLGQDIYIFYEMDMRFENESLTVNDVITKCYCYFMVDHKEKSINIYLKGGNKENILKE